MPSNTEDEKLQQLAEHFLAIDALIRSPEIAAQVGAGITREISYAISSFRQRFPERCDPQRPLL